jgi:hypothetical protein
MKEMASGQYGVTVLGRTGLRYRDGAKTVFIDAEMLAGAIDLVVYTNTIKAWEATSEAIGDAERAQIIANIRRVLEENRVSVEFE